MLVLKVLGWASIALGAVILGFAVTDRVLFLISPGVSGLISGVVFLALDRGLELLADIRDRLGPAPTKASVAPELEIIGEQVDEDEGEDDLSERSFDELSEKLEQLRRQAEAR